MRNRTCGVLIALPLALLCWLVLGLVVWWLV